MFKKSLLALSIAAAATMSANVMAAEESAAGDQYVEKLNEFLSDASLSGVAVVDTRSRTRTTGKPGGENGDRWSRLDYSAYNLILGFNSGYHDGWLGADLAGYFSGDLYNNSQVNGASGEKLCNEISTCNNLDWGAGEGGAFKVTTAALKLKGGIFDGKVGFIQSSGNGTIGNVWSFVPGTYRGAELNANFSNGWKATYFIADQFTAPWLLDDGDYAPAGWADTKWGILHSLGVNGKITDSLGLQVGIGQATDVRYTTSVDWGVYPHQSLARSKAQDNTSYKFALNYQINDTMSLAYDFYGTDDDHMYDGLGYFTGLAFNAGFGQWSWMSNLSYADSKNGNDVNPRTIYTYGMGNGMWSQWWDALSDWNKSGEVAFYNRLSYNQGNGWNYYLGVGYGAGVDKKAQTMGDWHYDSEVAVNGTISYSLPSGPLKGATVRLHATYLERDEVAAATRDADETDVRFQVIVPYNFL